MHIVEISAGAAMLAVLLTLLVQMFAHVRNYARRAEDRAAMLRVVENLMEECTAAPWAEIDDDAVAALKLPEEVERRWPQAALTGKIADSADRPAARQVTLTLSPGPQSRQRPVTLTAWVFKSSEN
jgi:hypothetical protein